jgi:hypothetical protein
MMPTRKVGYGALIAQLSAIGIWALEYFARVTIPPEIAVAGAGVLITVFQYIIPDKR